MRDARFLARSICVRIQRSDHDSVMPIDSQAKMKTHSNFHIINSAQA